MYVLIAVRQLRTCNISGGHVSSVGHSSSGVVAEWGARWPSGLENWTRNRVVLGSNPTAATSLRNFANSVYPALPVSFGGDTKSPRSLLSGGYARGSKRSHRGKCGF